MSQKNKKKPTESSLNGINYFHVDNTGVPMEAITTSTSTFVYHSERNIEDVKFIENDEGNFIEITYNITSDFQIHTSYSYPPKRVMLKERYGVVDGKMKLIKTISGTETPGHYVPPSIEWEE